MRRSPNAPASEPYPECPNCGVWVRTGILCRNCGAVLSSGYSQPDDPQATHGIKEGPGAAWPPAWLLWPRMSDLSRDRR